MPDKSTAEFLSDIAELDQQIAGLENDPWEQLGNAAAQAQSVDSYLGSVIEDLGEAGEEIDEQIEECSEAAEMMDELLDNSEFTDFVEEVQEEFLDPVQGGLKSSTNVLEEIQGGVAKFKELLEILQLGEGLNSGDAQEQLETAAEAYELIVGKLEPFIDKMPVIGAFIQLWGLGIKRAAEVAGVLTEIVAGHNEVFSSIEGNEGRFLYWTDEALRDKKYRDLVAQRATLMGEAVQSAQNDREATEPLDDGTAFPYEIVVESAIRNSADALPELNSEAYRNWVTSSDSLHAADEARGTAYGAYVDEKGKLNDAEFALNSAGDTGADTSLQDARDSQAGALERAEANLAEKNEAFDTEAANHRTAEAAHRAEGAAYDEAVKTEIYRLNQYEHLDDGQLELLGDDYPQWDLRGWEPSVAAGVASATAQGVQNTIVGGAVVGAGMNPKTKRIVMIGGGGIFAMSTLVGGFIVLNGNPETVDPQAEIAAVSDESQQEVEENAASDNDLCTENSLGCQAMGALPGPATASVTWADAGCSLTPEEASGEITLGSGATGVSFHLPGDGPGHGIRIGNGDVIGRGFGGGTTTSDGVTTGTNTVYEPTGTGPTGFSGLLKEMKGPADAATGEVDLSQAECTYGGAFEYEMDAAKWDQWLALPLAEEAPLHTTDFACSAAWDDGFPVIYWLVGLDSPIPDPPTMYEFLLQARLSTWGTFPALPADTRLLEQFQNTTLTPQQVMQLDPNWDGTIPPELKDAYKRGSTWGRYDFGDTEADGTNITESAAEQRANALQGFEEGNFVELQITVTNGIFAAFTTSIDCPWR